MICLIPSFNFNENIIHMLAFNVIVTRHKLFKNLVLTMGDCFLLLLPRGFKYVLKRMLSIN